MSNILAGCCGGVRPGHARPLRSQRFIKSLFRAVFVSRSVLPNVRFLKDGKVLPKDFRLQRNDVIHGNRETSYARKVCRNLVSTGTRAIHLAPVIRNGDVGT